MTEQAGQILRMARPAAWWAKRAALHHRRGRWHQAEALYQHAVSLTPDDVSLKLSYARVLQEMRRYEASNRQAFAALALDPFCAPCLGLIGQNLMMLGYLEEAADAFTHALSTSGEGMAEAYAEQLDTLEAMLGDPEDCGDRYRILVQRAAEDLAAGEWESARQELEYACSLPRRDERCHELFSLYHKAQGHRKQAIREAMAACRVAPQSARSRLTLSELYGADHRRAKALQTLLLAAACVRTAEDERLLCQTALTLGFPTAPLPLLTRAGNRVQTLFNKAVLLLAAGQAQPALRALDQCRALDPDDVPTRFLRRTAQTLAALPSEQAAEYVKELRLYPALSDADSQTCYRTFLEALSEGTEAFAKRLQADESLYRLTLYQAESPQPDISGLLEQVIPYLSENFTVKMLREILLLPAGGVAEKQLAIQVLMRGNPTPFVLWHGGRLSFIRPHGGGDAAAELRLKDLLLYCGAAGCDAGLMAHLLRLIRRMPPRVRFRLAGERGGAFLAAGQMHYAMLHPESAVGQMVPRLRHVRRVCRMLARVAPIAHQTVIRPRLWLSRHREEIQ
jgi:tetratricopeptide (TPR) repeat protein